jgi:hypothetical protein
MVLLQPIVDQDENEEIEEEKPIVKAKRVSTEKQL